MTTTAGVAEQIPCPDCYVSYTEMPPWIGGVALVVTAVVALVGAIGLVWTCFVDDDDDAAVSQARARQSRKLYLGMTVGAVIVGAATALLETVQGVSLGGWWWALGSVWLLTAAIVAAAFGVAAHHHRTPTTPDDSVDSATVGESRS